MMFKFCLAACVFALAGLSANAFELSREAQAEIAQSAPGAFLRLPELPRERPRLPVIPLRISILPGPPLLFSDMPEYLGPNNGIAMREEVPAGKCRLYLYHVPGTKTAVKTISVVVQNLGAEPLQLRFDRCGRPAPGMDYGAMGVGGLMEFFTGHNLPPPLLIPPGGRQVLDSRLEELTASDPQLVHVFYEFHLDQPARLFVLQRDPGPASVNIIDTLPAFPRQLPGKNASGAGRGIFPGADRAATNELAIDSSDGVQRLVVADGRRDRWVTGNDGLAGNAAVTNKGSYGVIYHLRLARKSGDGRPMAILVGRANGETRPLAAVRVDGGDWQSIIGNRAEPRDRGAMALVQKLSPVPKGATNYVEITYSPPGGSSLPTPIYFAPFVP